jgi:hypothetical protein
VDTSEDPSAESRHRGSLHPLPQSGITHISPHPYIPTLYALRSTPYPYPSASLSLSLVYRFCGLLFLMAMARAFFVPTRTTSFLPLVIPV